VLLAESSQEQQPELATVVTTLVIGALFNPLRRRVQAFVDRRFYSREYDARNTLEAFSSRLRDERNLDSLNAELLTTVRETMQPASVSLWLPPDTASQARRHTCRPRSPNVEKGKYPEVRVQDSCIAPIQLGCGPRTR
jgi:hypothetical protein